MGYKDPAYVIFDGDEDSWAYQFMRGWKSNERIDFDFRDAHDLDSMTSRAQGEEYVKRNLRSRLGKSGAVIVLIGEKTKNLYRFVRWEIDAAINLDIPIIAVNLNNLRQIDAERCPPVLRDHCAIHVSFRMKIIKYALDYWPSGYAGLSATEKAGGPRHYAQSVYQSLGLGESD